MRCLTLLTLLVLALLASCATAAVVINGVCQDCSPPDAETLVVGDRVYKGRPGQGTVYINGQGASGSGSGNRNAAGARPYVVPDGYSGRVPGGSYVHNSDCNGCDIRG
ncbi:immune-induced peptide 23 isoform X3 [Drosophila hydei]|uniref:Immune-induced peptide 23 isoform X3 n=1 Tax=Drosophila hydei TaxID=7224 RepID=A0A6J1LLL5_DROHY|nr:immune-induced peptide 23 isoform X3 [Drosophila hydei]